jgi:hypothetical protein
MLGNSLADIIKVSSQELLCSAEQYRLAPRLSSDMSLTMHLLKLMQTFDPDASTASKAASVRQGNDTLTPHATTTSTDNESTLKPPGVSGRIVGGIGSLGDALATGDPGFPHPISTVGRAAKTAIQPGASVEEAMAGGSRAISIQEDNGTGVTPTASILDVDKASRAEGEGKGGEQIKPGTISTGAGAAIGDSATVGWLQNSRKSALKLSDATNGATLNEIVSKYVSPEFYGTPYHNAAIVVFAVLATRFVTIFALSWAWIIVILTFCVTMYSLSIERTRKRARDDIERELMKMKLSKNTETVGWMNNMLHRAWLILEPVLSGQSAGSVQKDTSPQADFTLLSNSYNRQHGRYGTPGCGPDGCRFHQVDHIHTR